MNINEQLASVAGSFALEGMDFSEENMQMGKAILSGEKNIDECISELYKKYGISESSPKRRTGV